MEDAVRFAMWLNIQRIQETNSLDQFEMKAMYLIYIEELEEMGDFLLDKRYR